MRGGREQLGEGSLKEFSKQFFQMMTKGGGYDNPLQIFEGLINTKGGSFGIRLDVIG